MPLRMLASLFVFLVTLPDDFDRFLVLLSELLIDLLLLFLERLGTGAEIFLEIKGFLGLENLEDKGFFDFGKIYSLLFDKLRSLFLGVLDLEMLDFDVIPDSLLG